MNKRLNQTYSQIGLCIASKPRKICSPPASREAQIKSIMTYDFTFIKIQREREKSKMLVSTHRRWIMERWLFELQGGTDTLENYVVGSYKIKFTVTIWSSNLILRHSSQSNKNLCLHKILYTSVHCSFLHNSQGLQTSRHPSPNGW